MAAGSSHAEPLLLCDGCGRPAGAEHLRERILRLELQSRFRPIHIATLLLADAPPARLEDWFYFTERTERARSAHAQAFFDDVLGAAGLAGEGGDAAARLAEFQRRSLFLAACVECPLEQGPEENFADLLARLAANLVKRIQFSYKPRRIVLLTASAEQVVPILAAAGLAGRLADSGAALSPPEPADAASRGRFRDRLAALLAGPGGAQR